MADNKRGLWGSLNGIVKNIESAVSDVAKDMPEKATDILNKGKDTVLKTVSDTASEVTEKATELIGKGKTSVINVVDANGSGDIDIEDFIILGLRMPGVAIDREAFLRAEFKKKYPQEVIDKAVETTPAQAGITIEGVDRIADDVIAYERNCVSGISTALGMPGGFAMAATIPTDIAQYYGFMLRAAQKLLYLYGFPEIDVTAKEQVFDSETLNLLTLCLGTMYGAYGANKALIAMANALARGVEKQLLRRALTKGTIYPIVKNVAKWFGARMTKQAFAGFFKTTIPVVGGIAGGAITFLSFKPCCDKLKESLRNTALSNPNGANNEIEAEFIIEETDESEE